MRKADKIHALHAICALVFACSFAGLAMQNDKTSSGAPASKSSELQNQLLVEQGRIDKAIEKKREHLLGMLNKLKDVKSFENRKKSWSLLYNKTTDDAEYLAIRSGVAIGTVKYMKEKATAAIKEYNFNFDSDSSWLMQVGINYKKGRAPYNITPETEEEYNQFLTEYKVNLYRKVYIKYLEALISAEPKNKAYKDKDALIAFVKYTQAAMKIGDAEKFSAEAETLYHDGARQLQRDIISVTPVAGTLFDIYGIIEKEDGWTGKKISDTQRCVDLVLLVPFGVWGKVAKGALNKMKGPKKAFCEGISSLPPGKLRALGEKLNMSFQKMAEFQTRMKKMTGGASKAVAKALKQRVEAILEAAAKVIAKYKKYKIAQKAFDAAAKKVGKATQKLNDCLAKIKELQNLANEAKAIGVSVESGISSRTKLKTHISNLKEKINKLTKKSSRLEKAAAEAKKRAKIALENTNKLLPSKEEVSNALTSLKKGIKENLPNKKGMEAYLDGIETARTELIYKKKFMEPFYPKIEDVKGMEPKSEKQKKQLELAKQMNEASRKTKEKQLELAKARSEYEKALAKFRNVENTEQSEIKSKEKEILTIENIVKALNDDAKSMNSDIESAKKKSALTQNAIKKLYLEKEKKRNEFFKDMERQAARVEEQAGEFRIAMDKTLKSMNSQKEKREAAEKEKKASQQAYLEAQQAMNKLTSQMKASEKDYSNRINGKKQELTAIVHNIKNARQRLKTTENRRTKEAEKQSACLTQINNIKKNLNVEQAKLELLRDKLNMAQKDYEEAVAESSKLLEQYKALR